PARAGERMVAFQKSARREGDPRTKGSDPVAGFGGEEDRCSGSGGSAAGRQRRSSTYPQVFLVNVPRRAITQALVLALRVVKFQPGANAGLGFGHCRRGIEVDLLIFENAPQPFDEDVVHASALTIHADRDTMPL